MTNVVRIGPINFTATNGKRILEVMLVEKYASSQQSFINISIKSRYYVRDVTSFTLEISEYTSSGTYIRKSIVKRKDLGFSRSFDFLNDMIPVDSDCQSVEIKVLEVDFVDYCYKENGFCYVEHQKEQQSVEVGEYIQIKRKRLIPTYAYVAFFLILATLLSLIVTLMALGRY